MGHKKNDRPPKTEDFGEAESPDKLELEADDIMEQLASIDYRTKYVFQSRFVDPRSTTPYTDATRCRKSSTKTRTRRPMNPFMVWAMVSVDFVRL